MKNCREGALKDIKVLDLTRVLSGPYCTMLLADFGAEVIKLEQPEIGDDSRHFGPFCEGRSAYFMSINRNKKSITLNLKHEKGKEIFKEIIKDIDVLVENFRPGTMEKLGLGYEVLKEINPQLIHGAISGFGQTGPYSKRAAYDGIVQAMGGIMSITGEKGGKPVKVGPSIGDIIAGMLCGFGILTALLHRKDTGKGQYIDVSMLDCQIAILENAVSRYLFTGNTPRPEGNVHTSIFPFQTFETADEDIMIAAGNNTLWDKLCKTIEREELTKDLRFETNPLRGINHGEMVAEIQPELKKKSAEQWAKMLDQAGVPCSPINTIDKVIEHPQVKAREMLVEIEDELIGKVKIPGIPVKMSETPGAVYKNAPTLGENTQEILGQMLNLTALQVEQLKEEGVI